MDETTELSADLSAGPSNAGGSGPGIDKRYTKLVRLAYLVLPATGRRTYRLAIAQRIVDASLPRRAWSDRASDHAYAPIRGQVLRQAMRPSPWLRIGLGSRLRRLPKPGPATPARLAALDPAVRAAYVLRRVEALPRSIVREQLVRIGVPDATDVVRAADQVPELALPRVAPGPPLPRRSRRLPLGVAGALTVAALVAAQAGPQGHGPQSHGGTDQPAGQSADQSAGRSTGRSAEGAAGKPAEPAGLAAPARPATPASTTTPATPATRPAADTGPQAATAAFWAGRLPGGVPARWICRRVVVSGRVTGSTGILVAGGRRQRTGCGHVHGTTVGGTWWRAPNGRWYFVAAAGRRFLVKVVAPSSFRYRVPPPRRGFVVVPGPSGGARAPHGRMTVTADRS